LEAVAQHATREKEETMYCLSKLCNNVMYIYKDHELIRKHLVQIGFMGNYFIWSKHGEKGVSIFLEDVTQHATRKKEETMYCPGKLCNNMIYLYKDHELIHKHLVQSGFMDNYFIWSKHGETQPRTENIIYERAEENRSIPYRHDDGGEDDVG
jgi:hypothetical protein